MEQDWNNLNLVPSGARRYKIWGVRMTETETKPGLGAALDSVEVGAPMPAKVQLPLPRSILGLMARARPADLTAPGR